MSRSQRNDNFVDQTFTVIADTILKFFPATQKEKEAFAYYRDGMSAQGDGEYAEALENYEEALRLEENPYDRSYILYNIGLIYASNGDHDRALDMYHQAIDETLVSDPDWAQQGRKGNLRPGGQPEYWLDPTNTEVRNYLTNLLGEIVDRYDVDGVQFDYIRYPLQKNASQYFGYGNAARNQFQKITGVDPATLTPQTDNSLWQLWTRFRTAAVSSFVQDTSAFLRQKKPNLILSAAVWPQANAERVRNLQQDWESWAKNGDVDLLVPMTYALNTSRLQQLLGPALEGAADEPVLFLPSLNLASLPQVQLRDQLQAIRDLPSDGYSLFATAHLGSEHQQILSQATSPLIPYRDPLNSALERFNALKKEWDFLLTNNQVWVTDFNLAPWRSQTARTQVALETLAKQPTAGWLKTARQEIDRSRQGLKEWLRLEKMMRPYRVKTWENRLDSMDALLHFAEVRLARKTAQLP